MNAIGIRTSWHRPVLVVLLAALAACSGGGGGEGTLDLNGFGAKYKINDTDITGWRQATVAESSSGKPFDLYAASDLSQRIDGPATNYVAHGCRYAMFQELIGPDPKRCTLVAMDFVTEAQAASMVAYQKTTSTDTVAIPGYDAAIAFGYPTLTGLTVYANLKALYLEVGLDGDSNQSSASETGASFLKVLEAKNK